MPLASFHTLSILLDVIMTVIIYGKVIEVYFSQDKSPAITRNIIKMVFKALHGLKVVFKIGSYLEVRRHREICSKTVQNSMG